MTNQQQEEQVCQLKLQGVSHRDISEQVFGVRSKASTVHYILKRRGLLGGDGENASDSDTGARILLLDIETAPMEAYIWSQWQKFISLDMLKVDWYIIAWAAKWLGEDEIYYKDVRATVGEEEDGSIMGDLWDLLDEADIVVTQNGDKFDIPKINSRFLANGYQPPSPYRKVDILKINKRVFGHTSNKLEYLAEKFNVHFKKLQHEMFPGFKLWKACLNKVSAAWEEMEVYNKHDVLSLEELYIKLAPWDNKHPNVNVYTDSHDVKCTCGCTEWERYGYAYTNLSRFQQYRCKKCGKVQRGRVNLLSKEKRKSLTMNVL